MSKKVTLKGHPLSAVFRALASMGWTLSQSKHIKLRSPKGRIVSISVSPSCQYGPTSGLRDINKLQREEGLPEFNLNGSEK